MSFFSHKFFGKGKPILDKEGRLFGKVDIFKPLFLLIFLTLAFFILRVLLQKDQFVTVELYASGGEWWFNNPEPPYWLADPIKKGYIEYDPQGGKLVEILETQKFEINGRKMLWIKAKLKVVRNTKAQQFRFRREPLQIGSLIYVSPNNTRIYCSVLSIDEEGVQKVESEKTVTLKQYAVYPWQADTITVGDTLKNDQGTPIAEILDKTVDIADITTTDDKGNTHVRKDPLRRNVTVKIKIKTQVSTGREYFSYFQPLKIGFNLQIPFDRIDVIGAIVNIE